MTTPPLIQQPPDWRSLPSISALLLHPAVAAAAGQLPATIVTQLAQAAVADERRRLAEVGGPAAAGRIIAALLTELNALQRPQLGRLLNGSGVILQTNLGRAPVSAAAAAAMAEAAAEYIPLEFDLASGRRGDRMAAVRRLLCRLTGAEDALVVNNNAAATLLMLSALAAGREVILSRGEAVEIGGGVRIPEIMAQSGARLIEVGTTNRTYPHDYEQAINAATAALLKVHSSNFRIIGFTESVDIAGLAALAERHGLLALDDLGSGALLDTATYGLAHEPMLSESIAAGAAVVCASGDKLLGGPQAGILVGRRAVIERLRRHPLARAVRADKCCLAGLEATLRHYLLGEAVTVIPVWRMIATPASVLAERAERWRAVLSGLGIGGLSVRSDRSAVGGGSLPGETLPTWVLAVEPPSGGGGIDGLQTRLRSGRPALVARVADGRLLIDPRTIAPADDIQLPGLLAAALTAGV